MVRIGARDRAAVFAARAAGRLTRAAGRAGTSLPGLVATRLSPGIIGRLAARLGPVVLVSGTNGKTTTALTIAGILRTTGRTVVSNPSGANLGQAIATAIVARTSLWAEDGAAPDHAVFEVDEAALPALMDQLPVAVLLLTNLFRDQLDRFGETDRIVRLWRTMLARHPDVPVVFCADDSRVAALVRERPGARGYGFAERPASGTSGSAVTTDVTTCPVCAGPLLTTWVSIGHLGDYRCTACDFARPMPWVGVSVAQDRGLAGQTLVFALPDGLALPGGRTLETPVGLIGTANAYNAAGALAVALALGVDAQAAARALADAVPAFARWETLDMEGRRVVLSLVKNPASLDEVTRSGSTAHVDGVLFCMNDQHADGRDVSWYWDVDPTALVPGRRIAISGTRGPDLLLRLRYQLAHRPQDGIDGLIGLFDRPIDGLDALVREVPVGGSVLVVSTYTALLGVRAALVKRGLVPAMPT